MEPLKMLSRNIQQVLNGLFNMLRTFAVIFLANACDIISKKSLENVRLVNCDCSDENVFRFYE